MSVLFNRRKKDIPQDNPERWLLTYADLITLLLAFFIVMYSMSRIDAKRFGRVSQALHGILKGGPSIMHHPKESLNTGHGMLNTGDLNLLQTQFTNDIDQLGRKGDINTEMNERGLVIHIMESAMFDEGSAWLKPKALQILDLVSADIISMPNHVRVEGHTDNRPIHNAEFASNWELSTARATTVVRYLIENHGFPPDKISAVGFAEYRPYVPNNTIENRALNRRVDIVVLTMELSAAEPGSDIDAFSQKEMSVLRGIQQEIDSPGDGNNFPH